MTLVEDLPTMEGPLLPALAQEGEACEAPIPSPSTAASNTVIDDEPCLKRHKAEEVNGCGGLSDSAAAPELPTVAVEPQPPPPDPGVVIGALPSESASDGPTVPSAPVQRESVYQSRDALAKAEEERGELQFRVITNDGDPQHLKWLIALKCIISQQLPKMPREYITRLVLDRRHKSLVIVRTNTMTAIGGICYRPFYPQQFAEIAFLAITSSEQVRGYGTRLMNHLKQAVKPDGITNFVTYADNYAVGYFQKQGFTKGVTMSRERWYGYIKDYDGGTLMECTIYSEIDYLDLPGMVRRQTEAVLSRIREVSVSNRVYPSIHSTGVTLSSSRSLMEIPGVAEAGWTVADAEGSMKSDSDRHELQSSLRGLVRALQNHSDGLPFLRPVSKEEAPDYYDVIKEPIDLSAIMASVEAGAYITLEMFRADLARMFANCRQYNLPTTSFVASANKLESYANSKLRQVFSFFNFGARFGMLAPERGPGEDLARTAAEDEREIVQKSKEELAREAAEAAAQAAAEAKERRIASLDLFALCAELGQKGQQFDVESDAMVETFVRGEDCLECIRQIFREVRKMMQENDPWVLLRLAEWRVVQSKLLPMLTVHLDDRQLVYQIMKLLTSLTMEPLPHWQRQPELRRSVLQYKSAILSHNIVPVFMELLVVPLSLVGSSRTDADTAVIELVLCLFRNLLQASNPSKMDFPEAGLYLQCQEELITVLAREHFLDTCCGLAQTLDANENASFVLLLLDVYSFVFQGFYDGGAATLLRLKRTAERAATGVKPAAVAPKDDPLLATLRKEKLSKPATVELPSRHSRFGAQFVIQNPRAPEAASRMFSNLFVRPAEQLPEVPKRPPRKGGKRTADAAKGGPTPALPPPPPPPMPTMVDPCITSLQSQAALVVHDAALALITDSYEPLMRSLKNKFIRDTEDLQPEDHIRFLNLASFLMSFHRLREEHSVTASSGHEFDATAVAPTLDIWSFSFVMKCCDSWFGAQNHRGIRSAAVMLKEMILTLMAMQLYGDRDSKDLSLAIQKSVFYERDILDMLPNLLRKWEPGVSPLLSLPYLVDLIDAAHSMMKMARGLAKLGLQVLSARRRGSKKKKTSADGEEGEGEREEEDEEDEESGKVSKRHAHNFDLERFLLEFAHPNVFKAYVTVLAAYASNTKDTNHKVVTFLLMLSELENPSSSAGLDGKKGTFKPMLYHISLFGVINSILHDKFFRSQPDSIEVVGFSKQVIRHFVGESQKNPILFVEALFYHSRTTLARLSRGPLPKDAAVEVEEEEAKEGKEAVVAGSGEGGDKPPVAVVEEDDFEWL